MRPLWCNGRRIGYALVEDGKVKTLDIEEGFFDNLPSAVELELRIELDSTVEKDPKTGDVVLVQQYLVTKFTW